MCLAVPGKIVSVSGEAHQCTARIDYGGVIKQASLALLPEAQVDDYVVVHAGIAIARLNQSEAERTLAEIEKLDFGDAMVDVNK